MRENDRGSTIARMKDLIARYTVHVLVATCVLSWAGGALLDSEPLYTIALAIIVFLWAAPMAANLYGAWQQQTERREQNGTKIDL